MIKEVCRCCVCRNRCQENNQDIMNLGIAMGAIMRTREFDTDDMHRLIYREEVIDSIIRLAKKGAGIDK